MNPQPASQARLFAVATQAFLARVPELNQRPFVAVDLFAGGGGASAAIEQASGHSPVLAINHSPAAIRMHQANHPDTYHLCEDIFDVEPLAVAAGLRIDLAWFSPDCTHFSRAKGGKPRKQEIRGLAWVVVKWAELVQPRVICLENVAEFLTWGPLYTQEMVDELTAALGPGEKLPKHSQVGRPIPERKGETFREWLRQLQDAGYVVEWRVLNAADYGAPTCRKRLFLVARCDGESIEWPEVTHGTAPLEPYRTAAECIDWAIPCPSIFGRKRPLAEKTQARIAEGLRRYFFEAEDPYLVEFGTDGTLAPTVVRYNGEHPGQRPRSADPREPLPTVTTEPRFGVAAATLINTRNGERKGQAPRARDIERPMATITAQGSQGALVQAWLANHHGGVVGNDLREPMGSITGRDSHGLVAAHLTKFCSSSIGSDCRRPVPTITGQGEHIGLVAAFLLKYYGSGGQWSGLDEPMHTIVSRARMGLVTVELGGQEYAVVDIGMRMLQPHELAQAQGLPEGYELTGTKTAQIRAIGNSVSPFPARALVEAQFGGPGCPAAKRWAA